MSDEGGTKIDGNGSFQETDSFDEPKGVPISLEPVFSTAGKNIRIGVKQESIDKSKLMLNNDLQVASSSKGFSSPLIRSKNNESKAFVSPFRGDVPCLSTKITKRPTDNDTGDFEAPPPKKAHVSSEKSPEHKKKKKKKKSKSSSKKERKEIEADVLRISRVYEKEQWRMILQESDDSPFILATCKHRHGKEIKFGDRIHVKAKVLKIDDLDETMEVRIKRVLKNKNNGARHGISRYPISTKPYCLLPKYIHDLSDPKIKKTVLQVKILDMNSEIFEGCSSCKHALKGSSRSEGSKDCKNCKDKESKSKTSLYSRMRVMDLTGQMFVNLNTKNMDKLLRLFGCEGISEWFEFVDPKEKKNIVFRPLMIEIEKDKEEWECTDVSEVNWVDYAEYLKEQEAEMRKQYSASLEE